jgi:hypothetical protein
MMKGASWVVLLPGRLEMVLDVWLPRRKPVFGASSGDLDTCRDESEKKAAKDRIGLG